MKIKRNSLMSVLVAVILVIVNSSDVLGQCYDVRVALDGSGDYTSVQDAIDAAPSDLTAPFVIYVAKGVYDEKLFIEKNFITIIGESRDSSIITTAVLRRVWRETNPSDWGAATINVADNATDLTLADLTIRNNFAEVFPDFPDNNDHTFAIRGGGHRVIIIDCNVVTTGGDTLSLWNTNGGMFYHNKCFFEGYVDYVAPRGYCYITDSEFYGYNSNASIWHDGSGGEDHKLVIRNSYFDGVQGFALGRFHREAQFMLLDCEFSETMQNKPIAQVTSDNLMWGTRVYYNNCHRPYFDWPWFWDNLDESAEDPDPSEVDAFWTFKGEWDPESLIDGLLPYAFLPSPADNEGCTNTERNLVWVPGNCAEKHLVYFGTSEEPGLVGETDTSVFEPGPLELATTYYWRIDEVTATDTIRGELWSFRTSEVDDLPARAFNPDPADGMDFFTNVVRLDWDNAGCGIDSFYIYYGTDPENLEFQAAQKYPAFFRQLDEPDSVYYWRVDSKSDLGVTEGDTWSFTLNPTSTGISGPKRVDLGLTAKPNPFDEDCMLEFYLPHNGSFQLRLFDARGVLVRATTPQRYSEGSYTYKLGDLGSLSSGVYYCQLEFDGAIDTISLVKND